MPLFILFPTTAVKQKIYTVKLINIFRPNENVYDGIPYKPFNKVIMVLLGTIGDDALNGRNSAWFVDCKKKKTR